MIQLYILEHKLRDVYYPGRALAILHQIDRAITASPEPLPDIEFSFVVTDVPDPSHMHHTYWALSRLPKDEKTWLLPDFGYWSWPLDLVGAYEEIRSKIRENEVRWDDKVPKALWRGSVKTNQVRSALLEVTRGKEWADVEDIKWKNRTDVQGSSAASAISIPNHCDYQFLIHTEGQRTPPPPLFALVRNSLTDFDQQGEATPVEESTF